jgi:uncharacterized membrane protein YjfL (UPF0719 family)
MTLAGSDFITTLILWFARAFVSSLICIIIGYVGIRLISVITRKINEFESIKGHPLATSLFVGGFFVYAGLVVYGSLVNPFFLSQSVTVGAYFNLDRLLVVIISFFVSLLFGGLFYVIFAKLTPFGVDLDDINKHPVAVGAFLFCYEVFLGLIILASLTLPIV